MKSKKKESENGPVFFKITSYVVKWAFLHNSSSVNQWLATTTQKEVIRVGLQKYQSQILTDPIVKDHLVRESSSSSYVVTC